MESVHNLVFCQTQITHEEYHMKIVKRNKKKLDLSAIVLLHVQYIVQQEFDN